jgi:hypothetical protein
MGKIRSSMAPVAEPVFTVPVRVEHVLAEWGRWAAVRMGRSARVNASFRRAEQVICNPMFSPRYRAMLTAHYVHQAREIDTCRLLRLAHAAYAAELRHAALVFWERYRKAAAEEGVDVGPAVSA